MARIIFVRIRVLVTYIVADHYLNYVSPEWLAEVCYDGAGRIQRVKWILFSVSPQFHEQVQEGKNWSAFSIARNRDRKSVV